MSSLIIIRGPNITGLVLHRVANHIDRYGGRGGAITINGDQYEWESYELADAKNRDDRKCPPTRS